MWYSDVLIELFQIERSFLSGVTSVDISHCNLFHIIFGTGKLQLFQPNQTGYYLLKL
jgi:hypothetical protein